MIRVRISKSYWYRVFRPKLPLVSTNMRHQQQIQWSHTRFAPDINTTSRTFLRMFSPDSAQLLSKIVHLRQVLEHYFRVVVLLDFTIQIK